MSLELDSKRNVLSSYGPRTTKPKFGGDIDDDVIKTAVWTFDYNDLPTYGASNLQFVVPANARIIDTKIEIITAFTSTSTLTDLDVGLATSAGVEIDLNGLITVSEATQTAIAVVGSVITGAGALIGKTIGATAGELVVTPSTADLLTGKARVLVRYMKAGV